MPQVAGVRNQVPQLVARGERPLRMRRHLHQVDVHVQQAGMGRLAPVPAPAYRRFEHLYGFRRVRALGDRTGLQIPQRPRRAVHDRLGEQRLDVRVVPVLPVHGAHRGGVVVVPGAHVGGGLRRRIAAAQRPDQGLLRLRRRAAPLLGPGDGLERGLQGAARIVLVERLPRLVVVRAGGVGDPPPGHRTVGVGIQRLAIARDRLLVVVAVGPGKSAVEPALRPGGPGGDRPAAGSEVVVVRHAPFLHSGRFERRRSLPLSQIFEAGFQPTGRGCDRYDASRLRTSSGGSNMFRRSGAASPGIALAGATTSPSRSMPAERKRCSPAPPRFPAGGFGRSRGHGCHPRDASRS